MLAAPPAPSTTRAATVARLAALGVVAVVRLPDPARALDAVAALAAGGVTAIELTLTTPGALELLAALARTHGDALLLGAGSVLDAEQAERAVAAGARYVVSPVLRPAVIAAAHRGDAAALPGGYTPTELLAAHEAGADLVKLFPADGLGPGYLRAVRAPMPFLRLVPTGGATPETVGDWLRAGAVAVGLGSALVDPRLVAAARWDAIAERARTASAAAAAARVSAAPDSAPDAMSPVLPDAMPNATPDALPNGAPRAPLTGPVA